MQVLNYLVLVAKKEGTYSEAVSDITAEHITVKSERTLTDLVRAKQTEAKGDHVDQHEATDEHSEAEADATNDPLAQGGGKTKCWQLNLDRGISYQSACDLLSSIPDDDRSPQSSFYLGVHPVTGQVMPLLAILKTQSTYMFSCFRPNSGRGTQDLTRTTLLNTYRRVTPAEIQTAWTEHTAEPRELFRAWRLVISLCSLRYFAMNRVIMNDLPPIPEQL